MKLSRKWLCDYTNIQAPDREFSERMTMSGSKVEGYAKTGEGISGVVVGRVKQIARHENSDHLWVCKIDVGGGEDITIVTGAQNVSAGDLVPVALDGSTLVGGVNITSGKLRGVESNGMLCSLKELGLDTHDFPYAIDDGIFILQEDCMPGQDIIEVLELGDSVIEFEITNNRPDCLSVRGLARESAVTFDTGLELNEPKAVFGTDSIDNYLKIEIAEAALSPRYTARMVKNIKIKPSPLWLRSRLRASGVRPINNIVDITNYVMLEYGQPMHAFDYACVSDGQIIVRRAMTGETLETLDGNSRKLTPEMLVIADISKPIGVAGVMGGGNSEITDDTKTIVFESANFNGTSVRKTSIALGMRTDASSRFEKGLDPENTVPAVERACELVEMLGAGEVVSGIIDIVAVEHKPVTLPLEPERTNALIGTEIDKQFMIDTLEKLGFSVENDMVTAPSWRSDIEHFADIAEEIARFYGYDKIESALMRGETTQGGYSEKQELERELGRLCRGMGFFEVMTYSFGSASAWDKILLPESSRLRNAFVIQNPLGEDSSVMRTTPLPSMLSVLASNLSHRNMDVRLYELATIYLPIEGEPLADERSILTLGAYGNMGFFELKGNVEAILNSMRIKDLRFVADTENAAYHPGRCAKVYSGDSYLGVMGQVHPLVCENFDLDCDVFIAELGVAKLKSSRLAEPSYTPLPKYPAVMRDISVVCDEAVTVDELIDCILAAGGEYMRSCKLFDVYTGASIPAGKRSVAFSLSMRAVDQTLTDEIADKAVAAALEALKDSYSAVMR